MLFRSRRNTRERSLQDESERQSVEARFFSAELTEQTQNPEDFLLSRVMSQDVLVAIDTLAIDFRMVVILADLQEFSYKEIAEILDCPVGTVMSRLFRGRKLLQKTLKEYAAGTGILTGVHEGAQAANTPTQLDEYRRRKKTG